MSIPILPLMFYIFSVFEFLGQFVGGKLREKEYTTNTSCPRVILTDKVERCWDVKKKKDDGNKGTSPKSVSRSTGGSFHLLYDNWYTAVIESTVLDEERKVLLKMSGFESVNYGLYKNVNFCKGIIIFLIVLSEKLW